MKIYYTGLGSNKNGEHTEHEFLDIINKEITNKNWKYELSIMPIENNYQLNFKDWILPDDFIFFTLTDWIEYSGAECEF